MSGILYGVSVGPGDPELMTIKAVNIINTCDIIAVPRTNGENSLALEIARQSCDFIQKEIIYLDFLMSTDKSLLEERHKIIASEIYEYLKVEKSIAFLNIGDISVYSTFSYISDILKGQGIKIEICPGITSFCAAAAAVGEPLVQGKNALVIMPSSCSDFDELLKYDGTKVIMKSNRDISEIKKNLKDNNYSNVNGICNCGLENESIYKGLDNIPEKCGYFTLITAVK